MVFKKGHKAWNKNKKLSEEHKRNLSKVLKGRKVWNKNTKGVCKPNSGSFKKGNKPHNKGFRKNTPISISHTYKLARDKVREEWHCVYDPKQFVVHHIDGNPFNNDNSNLVLIGRELHISLHRQEQEALKHGLQ